MRNRAETPETVERLPFPYIVLRYGDGSHDDIEGVPSHAFKDTLKGQAGEDDDDGASPEEGYKSANGETALEVNRSVEVALAEERRDQKFMARLFLVYLLCLLPLNLLK